MALRIGVVGTGVMGAAHADTLTREVGGAEVSVVTDIDLDRARATADRCGARVAEDAQALIHSDDVDAVLVVSHDSTHADLVIESIAAGKPVLCEKPLALTVEDCRRVVDAEKHAGRRLVSVGFSRRFDEATVRLRESVRSGAVGVPLLIHAAHRNVSTYPVGGSASSVHSSAIHEIDQIPWLLDSPIVEVSWHAPRSTALLPDRQDPQLILLRTADGVLSTVEVFVNATYGYEIRCEVVGERGTVSLAQPALVTTSHELARVKEIDADFRARFADAYRRELAAWVTSIRSGTYHPDLADAVDGLRASIAAHRIVDAIDLPGTTLDVAPGAADA